MIIGLTGTMASGKGEVAKYLISKGFEHLMYSDILKELARSRGIELSRKNLQKLGNDIKQEEKNLGILSKKIVERAETGKVVADGVRNPDEIRELKKSKDAYVIAVIASQRVRFKRMRGRGRVGDPIGFREFKRLDNIENRGVTKGQEINDCIKIADYVIDNSGTLDELMKKVDEILEKVNV